MTKNEFPIKCPFCDTGNKIGAIKCRSCKKRIAVVLDDHRPTTAGNIRAPKGPPLTSRIAKNISVLFGKKDEDE